MFDIYQVCFASLAIKNKTCWPEKESHKPVRVAVMYCFNFVSAQFDVFGPCLQGRMGQRKQLDVEIMANSVRPWTFHPAVTGVQHMP